MNDNAKAWVAALRSGEYPQGQGYLRQDLRQGSLYCCLGVACEVAIKAGVQVQAEPAEDNDWRIAYDGYKFTLPRSVRAWLGLTDPGGAFGPYPGPGGIPDGMKDDLTRHNDASESFQDIADLIESEPYGLFEEDYEEAA